MTQHQSPSLYDQVSDFIDRVRPAVQADDGDLELVEVTEEGVVRIRLHGACVGCPSAQMTLRMGVEQHLQQMVPGVVSVEQVVD